MSDEEENKLTFRLFSEWMYLASKQRHMEGKCLEGDIRGQVHSPDLGVDEVYLARGCNVCGKPFVDGSEIVERRSDLELFIARKPEIKSGCTHFHLTDKDGNDFKNPYLSIMRVQPNNFLNYYNPGKEMLYIVNSFERELGEQLRQNADKFGDAAPLIELMGTVAGHRYLTSGEAVLRFIYQKYQHEAPLPPKLLDLVRKEFGDKDHSKLVEAIENANVLPLKFKVFNMFDRFGSRFLRTFRRAPSST